MESKNTIDQLVGNVIVNGVEVNRKNVHYRDDLVTILLDGNVFMQNKPIHFRETEYNLLKALTNKPGQSWIKSEILKKVWGEEQVSEYPLTSYISTLRKKIEQDSKNPIIIETIPNVGYQYNPQGEIKVQADPLRDSDRPLYKDSRLEIYENSTIKIDGHPTKLGPLEYRLLTTLASRPNQFWGKDELLEKVWKNYKGSGESLKSYIMKLRKMIEPDSKTPIVIIRDAEKSKSDINPRYGFQIQGEMKINVYAPLPSHN